MLLFNLSVASDCFATSWAGARQDPLFVGFSRQEHWSGLPFPSPCMYFKLEKTLMLGGMGEGGEGDDRG